MNIRFLIPLAFLGVLISSALIAQDTATEGAESAARSVLSDPRLQNMLRSVKNDPEGTIDSVKKDPDEAVREATRIFQENKDKIDTDSVDTPENRAKAQKITEAAMSQVNKLKDKGESAEKVPATRSAEGATRFITPIAMPTEETATPLATEGNMETIVQEKTIAPLPSTEPTVPQIPDTPTLASADVPAPTPLKPKYKTKSGGTTSGQALGASKDNMEIRAKESEMDNNRGVITFFGNVLVDHPDFDIKCDKLEIFLSDGATSGESSGGSFKRVIASGGMVEIRRVSPEGELQVALARRADYNGISKDIVLSGGPPSIQAGEKLVDTNSPDAQIIMRGNGKYEVNGSGQGTGNRVHMVFPVEQKPGASTNIGIGQGVGGSIDKLR